MMSIPNPTNMDYLIPSLRLRIGDINSASYRYLDEWLRTALVSSVQTLAKWWNNRYLITTDGTYNIYRNPNSYFIFDEATYGVIQIGDDQAIVLMAAYLILEGSLENSAWDFVSWADAEIRFSNLESSRARGSTLTRLWEELSTTLGVPQKRLARALKMSLPGFVDNDYERDTSEPG